MRPLPRRRLVRSAHDAPYTTSSSSAINADLPAGTKEGAQVAGGGGRARAQARTRRVRVAPHHNVRHECRARADAPKVAAHDPAPPPHKRARGISGYTHQRSTPPLPTPAARAHLSPMRRGVMSTPAPSSTAVAALAAAAAAPAPPFLRTFFATSSAFAYAFAIDFAAALAAQRSADTCTSLTPARRARRDAGSSVTTL